MDTKIVLVWVAVVLVLVGHRYILKRFPESKREALTINWRDTILPLELFFWIAVVASVFELAKKLWW